MQILVVAMIALAVFGSALREFVIGSADIATAATVFCGIFVQAIPFLALGEVISGLVAAFVRADRLRDGCRVDPRRAASNGRTARPFWTGSRRHIDAAGEVEKVRGPPRVGAMRLKLGRPDLAAYSHCFDVPPASPRAPLTVTWAGVTTLLIDDGESALLTDGFFSRPSLAAVGLRRLTPSSPRIDGCLARLHVDRLEAVLPVHTHYDHAMDSAAVAERTGATLVGGMSAAHVGRGHGLPEERIVTAVSGEAIRLGAYDVTLIKGAHCPPDRFPGVIAAPVVPPVKVSAYRCGEAWSTLVHHRPSDRTLLIVGSAGFLPGALSGNRADVVYLGVGQLGVQSEHYLVDYWTETVRTVGARRVVLIHWDDFFRPLHQPLRALPYAADDLDVSMRVLSRLAEQDAVALHLPTLWQRADPWLAEADTHLFAALVAPAPRRS